MPTLPKMEPVALETDVVATITIPKDGVARVVLPNLSIKGDPAALAGRTVKFMFESGYKEMKATGRQDAPYIAGFPFTDFVGQEARVVMSPAYPVERAE